MSKKANPTTIGLFFALGITLGVAGLVIFSTGSFFHKREKYILYFNASLKGLNPGAPVKFRGVTIGSVVEILIRHNQATDDFSMPVIIEIDTKLAQSKSDERLQFGKERLDHLIEQGFRGRMDAESLVTGVLYIGMDLAPNAPQPNFHQLKPEYQEIPTIPTAVQQLLANLAHLDIRGLSEKLNGLLARLDTSLAELNIPEINAGITNLLWSANHLVNAPDITNSFTTLRQTLEDTRELVKRIDSRVDSLADSVTNTLFDAQKTLADLRVGIRNVSDLLGPDSAFRPDLRQALEELSSAGRSVAELAEFLKRNPNALLTGTKRPKERP